MTSGGHKWRGPRAQIPEVCVPLVESGSRQSGTGGTAPDARL